MELFASPAPISNLLSSTYDMPSVNLHNCPYSEAQALLSSGSAVRGGRSSKYKGRNPLSLFRLSDLTEVESPTIIRVNNDVTLGPCPS